MRRGKFLAGAAVLLLASSSPLFADSPINDIDFSLVEIGILVTIILIVSIAGLALYYRHSRKYRIRGWKWLLFIATGLALFTGYQLLTDALYPVMVPASDDPDLTDKARSLYRLACGLITLSMPALYLLSTLFYRTKISLERSKS